MSSGIKSQKSSEVRRQHWIPWGWSYGWWWPTMWGLRTKPTQANSTAEPSRQSYVSWLLIKPTKQNINQYFFITLFSFRPMRLVFM